MSKPKDILDELTKEELLAWVRTQFFKLPKRSEILYIRWDRQSAEVLAEMEKENRALDHIDLKEHDRLAEKFNQSTDSREQLRLLEQMTPYRKALKDHVERSQAIQRKQKRVDALYDQIDIERQKESARGAA